MVTWVPRGETSLIWVVVLLDVMVGDEVCSSFGDRWRVRSRDGKDRKEIRNLEKWIFPQLFLVRIEFWGSLHD